MKQECRKSPSFLVSVLSLISLFAFGCVSASPIAPDQNSELEQILMLLPGIYSNRAQYEAAPGGLKVEPQIGSDAPWINYQFAEFKRVDVPAVAGEVIALEWRNSARDGQISRQRLWAFRETDAGVVMDFYSLKSEVDFVDDAALSEIEFDDLISYGDKCALPVRTEREALRMAIPDTCRIVSRSGRDMTLSAEITIGDGLTYKEAGILSTGELVFMVPGVVAYQFQRLSIDHSGVD